MHTFKPDLSNEYRCECGEHITAAEHQKPEPSIRPTTEAKSWQRFDFQVMPNVGAVGYPYKI